MNIKLYFNNFKKNYIENIVFPYNYSLLSTAITRGDLSNEEKTKIDNYSKNYWKYSISKKRKEKWLEYFNSKKLYKKIK